MYCVYIIRSINQPKVIYTGITINLKGRIKDHNKGKSTHTKKFRPWKLIFYCAFSDKAKAKNFEKYLKTASGRAFKNKRLI